MLPHFSGITIGLILADGQIAINGQIWLKWQSIAIWPSGNVRPIVASGVSQNLSQSNSMTLSHKYWKPHNLTFIQFPNFWNRQDFSFHMAPPVYCIIGDAIGIGKIEKQVFEPFHWILDDFKFVCVRYTPENVNFSNTISPLSLSWV